MRFRRSICPRLEVMETILAPTGLVYAPVILVTATTTALPPSIVPKDPNELQNIANQLMPPPNLQFPAVAPPAPPATATPSALPQTYQGTLAGATALTTTTATGSASVLTSNVTQQSVNASLLYSPLMEGVSW